MTESVAVDPSPRRVRVMFGGETIADSTEARCVWTKRFPQVPWYYFPREDVRQELLQATDHTVANEFLGDARHWSVKVGGRLAPNAAYAYPDSPVEAMRGLSCFEDPRPKITQGACTLGVIDHSLQDIILGPRGI